MKKEKFYVVGKIYCMNQEKKKVKITLVDEGGEIFYAVVPRTACNPKHWSSSDFIKVEGEICGISDSKDDDRAVFEFSQAVLKRIFTEDSENKEIDYCGMFGFEGEILHVLPLDEDNYILTVNTENEIHLINTDRYTLFQDVKKLDLTKKFRISGVVSFVSYHRFEHEGVVSQVNFIATQVKTI